MDCLRGMQQYFIMIILVQSKYKIMTSGRKKQSKNIPGFNCIFLLCLICKDVKVGIKLKSAWEKGIYCFRSLCLGLGCRIKPSFPFVGPGPGGGVFLSDPSPYSCEFQKKKHGKLLKARSRSATGDWTCHRPPTSFELRTARLLVGPLKSWLLMDWPCKLVKSSTSNRWPDSVESCNF